MYKTKNSLSVLDAKIKITVKLVYIYMVPLPGIVAWSQLNFFKVKEESRPSMAVDQCRCESASCV